MRTFEYKGYYGSAEVEPIQNVLSGRVLDIADSVTYLADTVLGLEKQFQIAVDDYLEVCKEPDDEPNVSKTCGR